MNGTLSAIVAWCIVLVTTCCIVGVRRIAKYTRTRTAHPAAKPRRVVQVSVSKTFVGMTDEHVEFVTTIRNESGEYGASASIVIDMAPGQTISIPQFTPIERTS
jgi:hypothetical protein